MKVTLTPPPTYGAQDGDQEAAEHFLHQEGYFIS
jgi:hypothetical protein